jgi:hypothetical protein
MELPPQNTVAPATTPLPLRFNLPQGWPQPSVDWLAANQGWDPPAGWAPTAGATPPPAGWVWWSRDPAGWPLAAGPVTARYRNGLWLGAAFFVVGLALTVIPIVLRANVSFVFWGALIFGPIIIAQNIAGLRRASGAVTATIRAQAAEIRQHLDTDTYQEHLRQNGAESLPFDQFLAKRGSESWSYTGQWPSDQNHFGVTEQFRIPVARSRGRFLSPIIFGVIALIAVVSLIGGGLGGSNGFGGGTGQTGSDSARGVSSASTSKPVAGPAPAPQSHPSSTLDAGILDSKTSTAASCDDDCFIVRVKTEASCTTATVVVDYYAKADSPSADQHQTFSARLTGTDYTDVVLDVTGNPDPYADIADAYCTAH